MRQSNVISRSLSAIFAASILTACGGSSDNGSDSFSSAYIQFYNVSPNSASTRLVVDDNSVSSSTYGDATSLATFESGDYAVELDWEDSDGQTNVINERTVSLRTGWKTLLFMAGDFDSPDIVEFSFERSDLDNEFYLYGMSGIADGGSYDLYIGNSGAPFSSANFISNINYLDPTQFQYWDNTDDQFAWPTGNYVIYLTAPGAEEVLFESQEVSFNFESDYFISVRNTSGANTDNLVVDIILNSTNTTAEQDVTATAQYRIYSALNSDIDLTVSVSDGQEEFSSSITGSELSSFTAVEFGDYQISATSADGELSFDNRLMTLNQGDSNTVVIFEDPVQGLTSLTLDDSTLPQTVQHELAVVNLLSEFNNLDIFFVRNDETRDSAQYKVTGLDYADSRNVTVPNDFYSIVVVFEDNLGIESLLYRSELIDFNQDAVYVVTIEPDPLTGASRVNVAW